MSAKKETGDEVVDYKAKVEELNKLLEEQKAEHTKLVEAYQELAARARELAEFIKRLTGL